MKRDMKLMWSSNGPHTNSGYGVFTRDILYRMLRDKWRVSCNSFWGIQGYPVVQNGEDLIDDRFKGLKLKCYPTMDNPWGSDALISHGNKDGANAVFTMQDVWTLDVNHLKTLKCWIPYCPIDKDPVPQGVLEKLQFAYRIITFSKFGQDALKKAGFTSTLILEGTDTEIFKPLDKKQCRADFNLPQDAFIFGMIAANKENPPRKGFQEALEAFKLFNDKHPEAYLMIHTQQMSPTGFPIQQYAQHLGILNKMLFVDPYQAVFMSDSHFINKEMNCFDVLLHPSQTEGFGLTIIEAQSAGIPAIINNCHSMPELIVEGKTGFACKTGAPRWTNDGSYTFPADINSLYEQMEKTFNLLKNNPSKVKNDCRKHIKANFNLDTIYEKQWKPFLEKLQDELLPQVLTDTKK